MTNLDLTGINKSYDLLNKYGKQLTYKQVSQGSYNLDTNEYETTTTTRLIKGLITKPKIDEINAGLATSEDSIILVASKSLEGLTISKDDLITVNNKDIQITSYDYVYSGEEIFMYKFKCKLR